MLLQHALVELCEEKSYYDITVRDICGKAQMYRSTFYRYYETKDELLREIEHEYVEETRNLTKSLTEFHADAPEEKMQLFLQELTADMEYHRANARLCRFLLSPAGDIYFHQKMVESIGNTVRKQIQKSGKPRSSRQAYYLVTYFASGFVSTVREWLIRDDLRRADRGTVSGGGCFCDCGFGKHENLRAQRAACQVCWR